MALVLFVEDQTWLRLSIEQLLTLDGHEVVGCETLSQAREIVTTMTPEFIISDYVLPDGDGKALISFVRARCARLIPAILLSGWELTELRAQLPPLTLTLKKPIDVGQLLASITTLRKRAQCTRSSGGY